MTSPNSVDLNILNPHLSSPPSPPPTSRDSTTERVQTLAASVSPLSPSVPQSSSPRRAISPSSVRSESDEDAGLLLSRSALRTSRRVESPHRVHHVRNLNSPIPQTPPSNESRVESPNGNEDGIVEFDVSHPPRGDALLSSSVRIQQPNLNRLFECLMQQKRSMSLAAIEVIKSVREIFQALHTHSLDEILNKFSDFAQEQGMDETNKGKFETILTRIYYTPMVYLTKMMNIGVEFASRRDINAASTLNEDLIIQQKVRAYLKNESLFNYIFKPQLLSICAEKIANGTEREKEIFSHLQSQVEGLDYARVFELLAESRSIEAAPSTSVVSPRRSLHDW